MLLTIKDRLRVAFYLIGDAVCTQGMALLNGNKIWLIEKLLAKFLYLKEPFLFVAARHEAVRLVLDDGN